MHTVITTREAKSVREFYAEHKVTFKVDDLKIDNKDVKEAIEELKEELAKKFWHRQKEEDIYDAIDGWDVHHFLIINKDGEHIEGFGLNDEGGDGAVYTYLTDDEHNDIRRDDIEFWIELPPTPLDNEIRFGDKVVQKCLYSD